MGVCATWVNTEKPVLPVYCVGKRGLHVCALFVILQEVLYYQQK